MPIIPGKPKSSFERELPSEDQHVAVITGVWDLGLHEKTWQGETKIVPEIMLCFEVDQAISSGEFAGEKMRVFYRLKTSLHSKAKLLKNITAFLGRDLTDEEIPNFDLESLVGKSCLIDITHNKSADGNIYANVGQISKLPKQLTAFTPDYIFKPSETPEWIQKIKQSALPTDMTPPVLD